MTRVRRLILLTFIFILGFLLRFYRLNEFPPELHLDEAGYLYATYSILQTKTDETGIIYPLNPRIFNVYYATLPVYLNIPSVLLFGISRISVRLPTVILGSLSIIIFYLLLNSLFKRKLPLRTILAGVFLFAVNPWHVQLSRVGTDFTIGLFFFLTGIYLFTICLNKPSVLPLFSLSLVASIYSYNPYKIITPLFILLIFIIYFRYFLKNIKFTLITTLVLVISIYPLYRFHKIIENKSRLDQINILNPDLALPESIKFLEADLKENKKYYLFLHNRRLIYPIKYLQSYLDNFKFSSFFIDASNLRYFWVPQVGLFYAWLLPLFIIGVKEFILRKINHKMLIFSLFLVSPTGSALALGNLLAHRAFLLYVPLTIFITLGINTLLRRSLKILMLSCILILSSLSIFYFIHLSFAHAASSYAKYWNYGIEKAITITKENQEQFSQIIITSNKATYLYFVLYGMPEVLPCSECRKELENNLTIGKYKFREINWEEDKNLKSTLLVGKPTEIPSNISYETEEIKQPDGETVFIVVKLP